MASKRRGIAVVAALLVLGLGITVAASALEPASEGAPSVGSAEPARVVPEVVRDALDPAPSTHAEPLRGAWRAKRDRIRAAALMRRSAPAAPVEPAPKAEPERCSEGCWGTLELQLRLAGVVDGCRELLPAEARGTARFDANVIAEPDVGAVVESVEVVDDAIDVEEFRDCIVESALLAELVDPEQPVSDRFRFRFSAGPPADNAAEFLGDSPELVERFPQLAALRDRPIDAPRSDEDATTFATIIAGDEAALAAFERWSVEQGVDLSGVRSDG